MNYRRLATLHHPDKSNDLNPQKFQDIQAAYQELKKFYSEHGRLPLSGTEENSIPDISFSHPSYNSQRPGLKLSSALYGLMTLILLILIFTPPNGKNTLPPQNAQTSGTPEDSNPTPTTKVLEDKPYSLATDLPPIELGMRMGKIFEMFGVPDDSVGEHWYYGKSTIFFHEGRVVGWQIDPDSPIRVHDSQPKIITPLPRSH